MDLDYDVTLIAGRREVLLQQMLASFSERVFRHFPIRHVIVNIDPFMGDAAEGDRCEALVRGFFPDATIFRPPEPDFATAVARVWAATTAPRVMHLEDDWVALEDITADRLEPLMADEDVRAVTFMCRNKHTRGLPHQTAKRVTRVREVGRQETLINAFSTSPGVFDGEFVREAARRMQPGLDPERQFSRMTNPEMEAHALPYRCMFMNGTRTRMLIEDIGRAYRDEHGLVRVLENGIALWRQVEVPTPE